MEEGPTGSLLIAAVAAVIISLWLKRRGATGLARFLPTVATAAAVVYALPVLSAAIATARRGLGLPQVPGDAVLFGVFVAAAVYLIASTEAHPRRVPMWMAAALGVATFALAPLALSLVLGKYSDLSLRADVLHCLDRGEDLTVTNTCGFDIVVGLCTSDERNPDGCRQSARIPPGGSERFDLQGQAFASLPAHPNGATLVACEVTATPSRTLRVGGRGHRGVCLP